MKKAWLLLIGILVSGCLAPEQPAQEIKIDESTLTRTSSGDAVSVGAVFMNPLQENKDELVFKVALNTHSVDLSGFRLESLAAFRNSEGIEVKEGFVWASESESSHHRLGYLKIPARAKDGRPLISENTEYIVLEIDGIEVTRTFKWEKEVLK